jgi:HSP20 family protein
MDLKNLIPFGKKNIPAKREEEHPFMGLQREMNKLFDDFFNSWGELRPLDHALDDFSPRIDLVEDEKNVTISAELPGMNEKDIDVSLVREALIIKGEKKQEKEERKDHYFYSERSYGSFSRTIPLPPEVDSDKIQAEFRKGILTITLPKTATAKETRKIAVKAE